MLTSRFSIFTRNVFTVLLAFYCQVSMAHEKHDHTASTEGYSLSRMNYKIPQVSLVDTNGNISQLAAALDDTPVMLNFIFTSCTAICPTLSATFSQVQKLMAKSKEKVNFVSISIDPEYDTPKKLKEYAEKFTSGSNWNFYTGQAKDIVKVQRSFDAYRGSKMNHIPLTYIRVNQNSPWIKIEGFTSAKSIIHEFRKALQQ